MSDQEESSSFSNLRRNKDCLCWYKVDVHIKDGTRQDFICVFIGREEDDTACFLQTGRAAFRDSKSDNTMSMALVEYNNVQRSADDEEVKRLQLREKADFSKAFQWKRSGQLKLDLSIGNLHRTIKIKQEKLEEMNFLVNAIVRLAKDTGANTTTLTINIKDEEKLKKKLIFSQDVEITLKKQPEKVETGQATEHPCSIEVPAQPPLLETGQATEHTEEPAEPVWQGFT